MNIKYTFFVHFSWGLLTEHTSFGMGEWLHTFFFSLLLELSAEAKSFLLVGSIRNTQGRAPEWREKWVLHNSRQSNGQLLSQWWGLATGNPTRLRVLLMSVQQKEIMYILNQVTFMYLIPDSNFFFLKKVFIPSSFLILKSHIISRLYSRA